MQIQNQSCIVKQGGIRVLNRRLNRNNLVNSKRSISINSSQNQPQNILSVSQDLSSGWTYNFEDWDNSQNKQTGSIFQLLQVFFAVGVALFGGYLVTKSIGTQNQANKVNYQQVVQPKNQYQNENEQQEQVQVDLNREPKQQSQVDKEQKELSGTDSQEQEQVQSIEKQEKSNEISQNEQQQQYEQQGSNNNKADDSWLIKDQDYDDSMYQGFKKFEEVPKESTEQSAKSNIVQGEAKGEALGDKQQEFDQKNISPKQDIGFFNKFNLFSKQQAAKNDREDFSPETKQDQNVQQSDTSDFHDSIYNDSQQQDYDVNSHEIEKNANDNLKDVQNSMQNIVNGSGEGQILIDHDHDQILEDFRSVLPEDVVTMKELSDIKVDNNDYQSVKLRVQIAQRASYSAVESSQRASTYAAAATEAARKASQLAEKSAFAYSGSYKVQQQFNEKEMAKAENNLRGILKEIESQEAKASKNAALATYLQDTTEQQSQIAERANDSLQKDIVTEAKEFDLGKQINRLLKQIEKIIQKLLDLLLLLPRTLVDIIKMVIQSLERIISQLIDLAGKLAPKIK